MTDQAPDKQPAGTTPLVQSSVKADTPRDTVTDPPRGSAPEDPYGQARLLRAQAAAIEASIPSDAGFVRMKVGEPHESFRFGGTEVGSDWTVVPDHLAQGVLRAAADAGVTVTQQEGQ
jgi:hypothetical protein